MTNKTAVILSAFVILMVFTYGLLNFTGIFTKPSITGNELVNTRLVVISEVNVSCNTTFVAGLNLVSFPCLSEDVDIITFLNVLNNSYESIRYYSASDLNDPWKTYNPNLPSWVVLDLSQLSRRRGYYFNFYNETIFDVNNSLATPTLISLSTGWNLIGYPSFTVRTSNETFGQLIPDFTYVLIYNASDTIDPWKEWTWNTTAFPSNQDINYTVPYYGYWIYMNISDTLIIN